MGMSWKRALLLMLALMATACASLPPVPPTPLTDEQRVGVIVQLGSTVEHRHVGTTVFNNFLREVPVDFDLGSRVRERFEKRLDAAGVKLVKLDAARFPPERLSTLVRVADDRWITDPAQADTLRALREEFGLSAIVLVHEAPATVYQTCSGECSGSMMNRPGLFTRSMLGHTRYFAVPAWAVRVLQFDPPADLRRYPQLDAALALQSQALKGFPGPKDFKLITAEEFRPVTDRIVEYADVAADAVVQALRRQPVRR